MINISKLIRHRPMEGMAGITIGRHDLRSDIDWLHSIRQPSGVCLMASWLKVALIFR
jgi:hypothetical protein